ncbi:MAG: serine hydrolase [Candidatus Staskawiczbacteria bacterium]|nr:serine hydrolase [Candidatus Staskawiczbacteria bacterium]
MNIQRVISGICLSLIFVSAMFFVVQGAWSFSQGKTFFLGSVSGSNAVEGPVVVDEIPNPPVPFRNWEVPELSLDAEASIAVASSLLENDKILLNKNSYQKLPIASLSKLMTAVVSLQSYTLSKKISVSEEAVLQDGEQGALELGKEMSVDDLLYIMLIASSNKAAYVLSEGMDHYDFVRLMNEKARELGMDDTTFVEPTGLSEENVSTADDLVKLAKYILKNYPEIAKISGMKEYDLPNYGILTNTDELLGEVPEIIIGKTGFTLEAKGCLLLVLKNTKDNDYLIYVILGADDKFAEMKKMIDWVNTAYKW